ncbi:fungal-specific transcription factor domain-containing protein [Schizophyllum amplum]|uniref:Fungal-specific transcription factor domain-containing protein n=1 Tax=Schizophyllum amplum TaxID=97359 RepID=A0A550CZ08_9AGAR|nr:fungal-specific transcription factor domain-containing protein [Auriculariopsis ampla]
MSTEGTAPTTGSKKRRLQGDSAKNPGGRCSNCVAFNSLCTHYAIHSRKRAPSKDVEEPAPERLREVERNFGMSVEDTNNFLLNMDTESTFIDSKALVTSILEDSHAFFQTVDLSSLQKAAVRLAKYARSLEETQDSQSQRQRDVEDDHDSDVPDLTMPDSHEVPISDEIIDGANGLSDKLWQLALDSGEGRYFGNGSNVRFIRNALDLRAEYSGAVNKSSGSATKRRQEFWTMRPWELESCPTQPPLDFPEHNFLLELVDVYFSEQEKFFPIMHRPTVDRDLAARRYRKDYAYGNLVLVMCAIAARHSDDHRVFADRRPNSENSAGWQWWSQVQLHRRSYHTAPSLSELQACALAVIYAYGTSTAEDTWNALSLGIRLAQEVGAHRKRATGNAIEDELYKRVFWAFVVEDMQISAFMGRPRATTCDDIDLDPVLEVEDEYWHDPTSQPAGHVGRGAFYNQHIRIMHILGVVQKTIYSVKKPRLRANMSRRDWEMRVVTCVDSALNNWLNNLPNHMRWDPDQPVAEYRDQAAILYTAMYLTQIQVHRPFIPSVSDSQSFPSLAICANAARACLRLIEQHSKGGFIPYPHVMMSIFSSCIILILYVWRRQQMGYTAEGERDVTSVFAGLRVMATYEKRWQFAGRLSDVIYNMFPTGGFTFSNNTSSQGSKRPYEADSSTVVQNNTLASDFSSTTQGTLPGLSCDSISEQELMQIFSLPLGGMQQTFGRAIQSVFDNGMWNSIEEGQLPSDLHIAGNEVDGAAQLPGFDGQELYEQPLSTASDVCPAAREQRDFRIEEPLIFDEMLNGEWPFSMAATQTPY